VEELGITILRCKNGSICWKARPWKYTRTIKLLLKEIDLTLYDECKNCKLTYFIGVFICITNLVAGVLFLNVIQF